MSTFIEHLISTVGFENSVTSSIYVNKFDYNSIKIKALKEIDDSHVDGVIYSRIGDMIDADDVYQEYEIYVGKVSQLNSLEENETTDNNTETTQSLSAAVEDKRLSFSTIRNKTSGNVVYVKLNMFINFYHYNMLIPDRNDTYICFCCTVTIENMEECRSHVETEKHKTQLRGRAYLINYADNIIRHVYDNCLHCGICNKIISKKDLEDHIKTDKKHDTLKRYSKACAGDVLKVKSEMDMNNYLNVQVANERMLLHKQYWHMYYVFPRKYFCSLCVIGGDVESLQEHLDSSNHLTRLSKCRILPEYGLSVIRTLTSEHHHCGVCNTYLIVDIVDNHIIKPKHKSNLSLWMELTKQYTLELKEKENAEDIKEKIEAKEEKKDAVKKVAAKKPDDPEIPNEDVVLEHNGSKFCLNVLSFNCIIQTKLKFYCVCCSKHMEQDELHYHMIMEEHKTALSSTEIISQFAENFIRKISGGPQVWAHCGICNCRMTYNTKHVQDHIETTKHRDNFTQHKEKMLKKSEQMAVARIIPKNPLRAFSSKSEKFSHEIEISNQKYNLNLHTFKAWHTIRGWGMYFSCCFVCQTILTHPMMYKHTRSQEHKENLKNCVILECYGTNYLKVINYSHLVYCTFCNDLVETDTIDSHMKSGSHIEKKKCGIIKLGNVDKENSELLIRFKKPVQPLDLNTKDVKLTKEERKLESCESSLRLEHSRRQEMVDAVASGSKLSELKDEHSVKTGPLKCQDGSFGALQEKIQNNKCYKDVIQGNHSRYIILDFLQDRILLTFNAWNTIVENTFCNTCKDNFITDVEKHCSDMKHIEKVNASKYYELSDGSIAREYSKSKITCLLCQSSVKISKISAHIQSTTHLKNLKSVSVAIHRAQSPHRYEATDYMNPVSISVTYMQKNMFIQNRENPTDGYVLLEFGNNKLMLSYNSWNGITENRMTCHICNDKYIKSDIASIKEHCDKDQHKASMRKKIIEANFMRKITKIHSYCMICNFIGNSAQSQEHIYSELHEIKVITARMQAAMTAGNGTQIINCSQYFNLCNSSYKQNAHEPAQTAVYNSKESVISEDYDSEDCSMNRDVGMSTEMKNSLIPIPCKPTADDKIIVKNMKIVDDLISSNNTVDNDNEHFSVTTIGLNLKSLESAKLSRVTVHEGSNDKRNDKYSVTADKTFSAVAASDVEEVAIKDINIDNKNPHSYSVSSVVTELCHVCGWAVPMQFYTEHLESKYHKKMVELVQAVLERIKSSINQICVSTNKDSVLKGIQYCSLCNCTLGDEEFKEHCHSNLHKDNVNIVGVIEQAVHILQSSGHNQSSETGIEELMSVESRSEDHVAVEADARKTEKLDKTKLDHTMLVPNDEKKHNSVNCYNKTDEVCSIDMSDANQTDVKGVNSKVPHYDIDVTVVDVTNDLVTLQINDKKIIIDKLSYHGIYPKPGNTLWCVLCKNKKDEDHLTSEKHLRRLNEIKFNGVDLIRYLSAFYAHCGLCHLMVGVTELEEHLKSETHESNRISAIIVPENESVRDKRTVNLKEFVLTQLQESDKLELCQAEITNDDVFGEENAISDTKKCYKGDIKVLDSKCSDQSMEIHSNTTIDTASQSKTNTEADGINKVTIQNEVQPSSSTGYVCLVCDVEVPSINEKADHEKSLRHVVNVQAQGSVGRERRPPSTPTNPNVASIMNKSVCFEVKNEFIQSHAGATFPYYCSLCDAKIFCFVHVADHLKGARHAQNLKRLSSNSVIAPNANIGGDIGKNSPLACTTRNTGLQNVLTRSTQNSGAVNKTKTAENNNEMTCTVCDVKVQRSIWGQHIQGKKHVFNLKEIMLVKSNVQNAEQIQTDNINSSKSNSNVQELSIKPNIRSGIEAQVNLETSNNEKNSTFIKVKPSLESTAVSANENQSRLQSIPINENVPNKTFTHEATLDKQIKSDFISFVGETTSCVYLCTLCNAKMPSLQHVRSHLIGTRHMMNLEIFNDYVARSGKVNTKESVATNTSVNHYIQSAKVTAKLPLNSSCLVHIPDSPTSTFCTLCNVKVPIVSWEQHRQGKTHLSTLNHVIQTVSSSSPSATVSGLPADKHEDVHRTNSAFAVKAEHSNEATMLTNMKSDGHMRAQNASIAHQSHSSAGLAPKPPLVERERIVPVQGSSSSVKIVKPKNLNQTVCTVCYVSVPNANMTEHVQGKLHLGNLKRMSN